MISEQSQRAVTRTVAFRCRLLRLPVVLVVPRHERYDLGLTATTKLVVALFAPLALRVLLLLLLGLVVLVLVVTAVEKHGARVIMRAIHRRVVVLLPIVSVVVNIHRLR